MVSESTDILIIGGGPAGATAGIALADAGYSGTIIEKQESVKNKICGEFYSPDCLSYLDAINGRQEFLSHDPSPIFELTVSFDGTPVRTTFYIPAYGLSRIKFDSTILTIAEKKGVIVRKGFEITDAGVNNGHVILTAQKRKTGEQQIFSTPYAIGATGAKSGSESLLVRPGKNGSKNSGAVAFKFHAECPGLNNTVELYFTSYGYVGIATIERGLINVCGLIDSNVIKSHDGNIETLLKEISNKDPLLRKRIESMKNKSSSITCSNLSFGIRSPKFKEILCIGDAAGSIHPFCGDGNAMALKSGLLAADVMREGIKNNWNRERTVQYFRRVWEQEFSSRIFTGSFVYRFLSKNSTRYASAFLTKLFPHVIHTVYSLTRDSKI